MSKKTGDELTIFISSTFVDLKEYREAVSSAILSLRNHAKDMIYWSADERDPTLLSLDELREADLVILLLAHRYGTIPPGETRSITEIEFDTAREIGLPVLAFFVDENHDWPGNKFDVKQYDKLLALKEKVRQSCTLKYFTSRESLAALATQAIANFDKRRRPWLETGREWMPPTTVNEASHFRESADLIVSIGPAEDGLPMGLEVSRSDNLEQPVAEIVKALGTLEEVGIGTRLDTYLRSLMKDAEKGWKTRGMYEIEQPSGSATKCYVTKKTVAELFDQPLLAFLLPAPMLGDAQPKLRGKYDTQQLGTDSMVPKVQSVRGQNRFLAVALQSEERYVVGKETETTDRFRVWHRFIPESLSGFQDCEYELRIGAMSLSQGKIEKYIQNFERLSESYLDDQGNTDITTVFKVSRKTVCEAMVQLLDKLEKEYHQRSVIHGDIKPQNCLVTSQGVAPIDSLELGVGEISPAISPTWAAPEQMAVRSVSAATDIYPVGLMLASLLSGRLAGEVIHYQVPLEESVTVVTFLRNPLIYPNPRDLIIPERGTKAWLEFIEKCLRFDPVERFNSASLCGQELQNLLNDYPPSGWLPLQLQRGSIRMVRLSQGKNVLCRVLSDDQYGGAVTIHRPEHQDRLCPRCGQVNRITATFCIRCRFSLRGS